MTGYTLETGVNGVCQISGVAVANLKNASFSIKNDSVEEYVCNGSNTPVLLAATNQHSEIKAEQLFTDNIALNLAQTPAAALAIIIGPQGATSGFVKYTFSNCIITELDLKFDPKNAISNNFTAKGVLTGVGVFP